MTLNEIDYFAAQKLFRTNYFSEKIFKQKIFLAKKLFRQKRIEQNLLMISCF